MTPARSILEMRVWPLVDRDVLPLSPPVVDTHAGARAEVEAVVTAIREAVAAAPPGEPVRTVNRRFASAGMLIGSRPAAFPGWAAVFTIVLPSNTVEGRPITFIDAPQVVAAAARGRRGAGLLVSRPAP